MLYWIRGCPWKTLRRATAKLSLTGHNLTVCTNSGWKCGALTRGWATSGGGDTPAGNLGIPGAGTLQEQAQLPGVRRSRCLGAAGMCHRRELLAGGCSELCRTARAVAIASTGAGLASSGMPGTGLSSCCSLLPAVLCTCLWSTAHLPV